MIKELQALEKLGNIDVVYNRNGIEGCYSIKDTDEFEIIKTALKDYEHSQKQRELYFKQAKELKSIELDNQNKLKALEIIKEKRVDVSYLIICMEQDIIPLQFYNELAKENYDRELTQEEYDILKEVLY